MKVGQIGKVPALTFRTSRPLFCGGKDFALLNDSLYNLPSPSHLIDIGQSHAKGGNCNLYTIKLVLYRDLKAVININFNNQFFSLFISTSKVEKPVISAKNDNMTCFVVNQLYYLF